MEWARYPDWIDEEEEDDDGEVDLYGDLDETPRPPPYFYRVQHDRSFTIFDRGFRARGRCHGNYDAWITPGKFHEHLDWYSRPSQPTPFISVFDNKGT